MFYSDDPIMDYAMYDAKQQAELQKLPRCCECDEHIQSEYCYEVNGEYVCKDCLENNHLVFIEDVIE